MVGNAASVFCGPFAPACAAAWTYEFSRAMGVSSSGALKAAFISGASAYAFQQIGRHFSVAGADNVDAVVFGGAQYGNYLDFGGNLLTAGQAAAQITAHAMVGGIAASVQGGKFGHGFFSAGVTKGAGGAWLPGGSNLSGGQVAYGTVVSAVIGGTASVIAGGKFANGAKTAVFQYLYNQAGRVDYRQIFSDVKRTWGEYWRDVFRTEVDLVKSSLTLNADLTPSASAFFLVGGVSVSTGGATDGSNVCWVTQACIQFGLGLYGGGGMSTSISGSDAALIIGQSDSWGLFYNVGGGLSHGGAVNFSSSTINGAKGFGGGGLGGNGGIQFCRTYIHTCTGSN